MGQKRSNADIVTKSAPQVSRVLAASDGSFDPALASLFASSVRCQFFIPCFLRILMLSYLARTSENFADPSF
jgi:hypothetical protein